MSHSIVSRLIISCVTFLEIWNFGYPFTAYLVIPPLHSFHSWGCAVCLPNFLYTHKYFYLYDFKAYVVCAVLILSIPAAHSHILSGGTHYNQQQRLWCSFQAVKSSLYGFAYFYTSVHPAHNLLQKICLLQAAPVKMCIQLQTFYGTSNVVCFLWGTS